LWLKYYKKHFDNKDIFILDDNSTDNSTENLDVNINKLNKHDCSWDHYWLARAVYRFQSELLKRFRYDVVLFTEIDEFVAVNPDYNYSLSEFIENMDEDFVRCSGWNVIHNVEKESPLDLTKNIMAQRQYGAHAEQFSKCLISKVPLAWGMGFHTSFGKEERKDLLLVHLHYFDLDLAYDRHIERIQSRGICKEENPSLGMNNKYICSKDDFKKEYFNQYDSLPKSFSLLDF
jgi:glycosyltransferase involved in cell wall biosynthesis